MLNWYRKPIPKITKTNHTTLFKVRSFVPTMKSLKVLALLFVLLGFTTKVTFSGRVLEPLPDPNMETKSSNNERGEVTSFGVSPHVPAYPSYDPSPNQYSPVSTTPSYSSGPSPYSTPTTPGFPVSSPVPDSYAPTPSSYPPEPAPPAPSPSPSPEPRGITAAYWASFLDFPATSIETSYFSHIHYAFLLPEPDTYKLNVTSFDLIKIPEFINALHNRTPPVQKMLAIGGGGNNRTIFSQMVGFEETRAVFIESTIEIARKFGFDGVDLDWEFPGDDVDMENLGLLFKQWRTALDYEAKTTGKPRLLLSSAVYYATNHNLYGQNATYPIESMAENLDWISPMCFDYYGSWNNFTGVHSALYNPSGDLSTSYGIGSWIQSGLPRKKIVMGLPLYGRTWILQDPKLNGIGAPALGVGPGDGYLDFNQIGGFNSDNNATVKFDVQTVSYYSYTGNSWVGYDDILSINFKVLFARVQGLGGYFFWALGKDKDWTITKQASIAWGN